MTKAIEEISKRATFAIISHPDAGKSTTTEKLILLGKLIQKAGKVKGKDKDKGVTSDWMSMEQERGISITSALMQFGYKHRMVNLLDTPGHEDFSEDTYRTLTAVDSALMILDGAKGVEERTIKLMEVCRMRKTPIFSFINKLDRDTKSSIELLDEIEEVLQISCVPMNWPLGSGSDFKGIYEFARDRIFVYEKNKDASLIATDKQIQGIESPEAQDLLGSAYAELYEQIELIKGVSEELDMQAFLQGKQTPVYFGTALGNFGIVQLLDAFVNLAPAPLGRETQTREVAADEPNFSAFVFKIQANMDAKHRDRIAFLRICSGAYEPGIKLKQVRLGKDIKITDAVSFVGGERKILTKAYAGDIVGFYNHNNMQIGDTFTQGEDLKFIGIPNFAPEIFKKVRTKDPLKSKQLQKGLRQLAEEGAVQLFMPLNSNDLILGAVGVLQFEVVAFRLKDEYRVDCLYEASNYSLARWVEANSNEAKKELAELKRKNSENLALDGSGNLTYLAPTRVNLNLTLERYPQLDFFDTREH